MMYLFEAKEIVDDRVEFISEEYAELTEYKEALEIASKALDAQIRLNEVLNDFIADFNENDTYSAKLTYDLLNQFRFDFEGDENEAEDNPTDH